MSEGVEAITPMSLRKRANKTQRQVAEALGKKVSTISDWECKRTKPQLSFSETKKLMELFNCSLDELIEAFEKPTTKKAGA